MGLSRRAILKGIGAAGIAGAVGGLRARGALGQVSGQTYKVLEIFLAGGLSHRDTLWLHSAATPFCGSAQTPVPPSPEIWLGQECKWGEAQEAWAQVQWGAGSPAAEHEPVASRRPTAGSPAITVGDARCSLALDPLVNPAFGDSQLFRTRVVAMWNPAGGVHELAIPNALGGDLPQRPGLLGIGAAVMRHVQTTLPQMAHPANALVLHPGTRPDTVAIAAATGTFGPTCRPATLALPDANVADRVARLRDQKSLRDGIGAAYANRYHSRLSGLRSDVDAAYQGSYEATRRADQLSEYLANIQLTSSSDAAPARLEATVQAAKDALTRPETRHVTVLDSGAFGHLDTHAYHGSATSWQTHATVHNHELWWILRCLRTGNNPIDFDDVLVVIHTEFGRTLLREMSDHCHWGYAALLIGGPTQGGSFGSFHPAGHAVSPLQPRDLRAGMLYALGIDPAAPAGGPLVPGRPLLGFQLGYTPTLAQYKSLWCGSVFGGAL